jgi:NhaA family Na+:H+ antiporter
MALAIFDDIGAVSIIAVFYSSDISLYWLLGGLGVFMLLVIFNRLRVKFLRLYLIPGILLWICFLYSGVHPTIAGVLLAFTIPAHPQFNSKTFLKMLKLRANSLAKTDIESKNPLTEKAQGDLIEQIRVETKHSNPPLTRLENRLGAFSSFVVIPLFVLANAGVVIEDGFWKVFAEPLSLGILVGLLAGKTIGVTLFTWLGVKSGLVDLPAKLGWIEVLAAGMLAAIGFTMSLFITNLAIDTREAIDISKISILTASFVAAAASYILLSVLYRKKSKAINE